MPKQRGAAQRCEHAGDCAVNVGFMAQQSLAHPQGCGRGGPPERGRRVRPACPLARAEHTKTNESQMGDALNVATADTTQLNGRFNSTEQNGGRKTYEEIRTLGLTLLSRICSRCLSSASRSVPTTRLLRSASSTCSIPDLTCMHMQSASISPTFSKKSR